MDKRDDAENANKRVFLALGGIGDPRAAIIDLLKSDHRIDPIIRSELAVAFEGPRDGIYFEVYGQSYFKKTAEFQSERRKRYFGAVFHAMIESGEKRLVARDRMELEFDISNPQADKHRSSLRADLEDAQIRLDSNKPLAEWWHSEMFEGPLTVLELEAVGWNKMDHPWLFILIQSHINGFRDCGA